MIWYINTKDAQKKIKFASKIFYVKVHRRIVLKGKIDILFNLYTPSYYKILINTQLNLMVNACNPLSNFISSPSPTQISSQISYSSPTQSPPKALSRRFGRRFGRRSEEKGKPDSDIENIPIYISILYILYLYYIYIYI